MKKGNKEWAYEEKAKEKRKRRQEQERTTNKKN